MILTFQNFIEELQEYISTNSDLSLNHDPDLGDVNFTIGDLLNISDLPDRLTAGSHVELTIYEDGGTTVPATRRVRQERTIRFLYKGDYGQEAVNKCWALLEWMYGERTFTTSTFRIWVPRVADKMPSIVSANQDGSWLADVVVTFFAWNVAS